MTHTQKESLSLFLNAFFLFFSPFLFFLSFFNFLSLFFSCVHATLHSLCLLVGQSVVSLVTLYFLVPFFLPHCSCPIGVMYGPCPPVHNFGSCVCGLVFFLFVYCWSSWQSTLYQLVKHYLYWSVNYFPNPYLRCPCSFIVQLHFMCE